MSISEVFVSNKQAREATFCISISMIAHWQWSGYNSMSIFDVLLNSSKSFSFFSVPPEETEMVKLSFIATTCAIKEVLMWMFTEMFTQLCSFYRRRRSFLFLRFWELPDGKVLNLIPQKSFCMHCNPYDGKLSLCRKYQQ